MNDKENDIIYTAQDIEAYVSGRLTALQMHAMEKAALDDSFLAEAMEGYGVMKPEDWKNELAALKTIFENKEEKKAIVVAMPKRNNNWWKVAAAVLLLGGTATISYLIMNKNNQQAIAKNIPAENKTVPVFAKSDSNLVSTNSASAITENLATSEKAEVKQNKAANAIAQDKNNAAYAEKTNAATLSAAQTPAEKQNKAAEDIANAKNSITLDDNTKKEEKFIYRPQKQAAYDSIGLVNKYSDNDGRRDYLAKKAVPATPPPVAYNNNANGYNKNYNTVNTAGTTSPNVVYDAIKDKNANATAFSKAKEELPLNHNFKAQVLGADYTPLPFANISIKGENFGTYADVKGNFNLVSSDSLLTVEVKAAGYQPKFYTLQSFVQQNKIVMAEDNANFKYQKVEAKSADVAARSKVSRKATLLKDSVVNVEPKDGWDNYNTYVNNNIEIPEDILTKDIHGQVELSFDVKSNGTIANIKVDKSLCDNCDELAKKLIQQGPQWKIKKGKKGKGKVTVQF